MRRFGRKAALFAVVASVVALGFGSAHADGSTCGGGNPNCTVGIAKANNSIMLSSPLADDPLDMSTIRGTANADDGVASVSVSVQTTLGADPATVLPVTLTCDDESKQSCTWSTALPFPLTPGTYKISAAARDAGGFSSDPESIDVVVL